MSQAQYNAIAKTRLSELHTLPRQLLAQYLESKPDWLRAALKTYTH